MGSAHVSSSPRLTRRTVLSGALAAGFCLRLGPLSAAGNRTVPRVRPLPSDGRTPIPLFGLGCAEKFPLRHAAPGDSPKLPEELVDYALGHGVTWLDTGYGYHGGKSEPFLGRVLSRYPRGSFLLSTKLPTWLVKSRDDAKRIFAEQLERCKTDYFDFYMLHSVSKKEDFERVYVKLGVLDWLLSEKKAGRIRHLGFSYHGKSDYLDELLTAYPGIFEVCMLMLNRMEYTWNPDAPRLPAVAAKHGVGVLVMEPLAGGRAAKLGGEELAILRKLRPNDSAARWGLRFAASQPGVICVFSGVNRLEYIKENIETLSEDFKPLSAEELSAYDEAIALHMRNKSIPCTGCCYCVPCPYGVRIPEIFAWYNGWAQKGRIPADEGENDSQDLRRRFLASYNNAFRPKERADRCTGCRKCKVPCPQWTFSIPEEMTKITDLVAHVTSVYKAKGGTI